MLDPLRLGVSDLQFDPEQGGGGRGAVDGPVAPGGRQTHRVVAVHVGQEEQPGPGTLPHMPEVHSQGRVRDHLPVHRHGSAAAAGNTFIRQFQVTTRCTGVNKMCDTINNENKPVQPAAKRVRGSVRCYPVWPAPGNMVQADICLVTVRL